MSGLNLSGVFGAAFGAIYGDGTLHRIALAEAENGDVTPSETPAAVKLQRDDLSEAQRVAAGYADIEARFLVLQSGVSPAPTSTDELTADGARWAIVSVSADPASTHWAVRARRK